MLCDIKVTIQDLRLIIIIIYLVVDKSSYRSEKNKFKFYLNGNHFYYENKIKISNKIRVLNDEDEEDDFIHSRH